GQSSLQAVVVGTVNVSHLVDLSKIGEFAKEWASGLFAVSTGNLSRRCGVHLIDVANPYQVRSMIADVRDIQHEIGGKGMLDAQIPVTDIRSFEVLIHAQNAAGRSG